MRVMRYRVELDDDVGYLISNAEPELTGGINDEQVRGAGIKMTVLNSTPSSAVRLLRYFEFREDNWHNPEFRRCYQRVLLGDETTGWKLVAIQVYLGHLWMEFANVARYEELLKLGDDDDKSPYYNESVSFMPRGEGWAKLRFEVERPESQELEAYEISISRDSTVVTEFANGQKQRLIEFLRLGTNTSKERRPSQLVEISCFC